METRDFFISYTTANRDVARRIANTLIDNGYSVYIQMQDSPSGKSIVTWMNDALVSSRHFIAVWSRAYKESAHCLAEQETGYLQAIKGRIGMFLHVRVEQCDLPILYERFGYVDFFGLSPEEQTNRLLGAVMPVREVDSLGLPEKKSDDSFQASAMDSEMPTEVIQECKVIFLGDGSAGKSSLIERIIHDRFEDNSLPTDGVKITKWSELPDGRPLTLNGKHITLRFMDFGGQEIMHSMHRCFLTAHTVYVVVCESRDDAEIDSVAARWMETVKSFAPDCPVILSLNKADLNPHVTVNDRALRKINPRYRHMIHTSAKLAGDDGVKMLMESILQEVLGCLSEREEYWGFSRIKQELEDMKADYILPEQFQKRCDHFNISQDVRKGLLNWLQDLGVAYTYSTLFRDMYVLNPTWLTNGIYRLILRTPNGGFLRHSVIRETLAQPYPHDISNTTYSAQEMEFILSIMRNFEISIRATPDYIDDGVEMIPMKMEKTPPPRYDDFPKSDSIHRCWEAGYFPNNLTHRIIIRKFEELDPDVDLYHKCVWRTGGWFRSVDGGFEALVEMTDKTLDVYVRGRRNAWVYLDSFRLLIHHILEDLNIEAKEWIYYNVKGKEGRIPYSHVRNLLRRDRKEVYLGDIDEFVSIEALLHENYLDDGERSVLGMRDFFISYNNANDVNRAAWIADILREEGYTVHFQADDCKPGMSFPQWMTESIAHSHGFLAVWSGSYENSPYCRDELSAAYVRTHRDSRFFLLPVRVENVPIRNPLLAGVVRIDLLSSDEAVNRSALLQAAEQIRRIR